MNCNDGNIKGLQPRLPQPGQIDAEPTTARCAIPKSGSKGISDTVNPSCPTSLSLVIGRPVATSTPRPRTPWSSSAWVRAHRLGRPRNSRTGTDARWEGLCRPSRPASHLSPATSGCRLTVAVSLVAGDRITDALGAEDVGDPVVGCISLSVDAVGAR